MQEPKRLRWSIPVIGLCAVLAVLWYMDLFAPQGEDPNWSKTHYETTELSDIEALCGTELLLDRMTLGEPCEQSYLLEIQEDGSFDDPQDWKSLGITVSPKSDAADEDQAKFFCVISFDGSTGDLNAADFTSFLAGASASDINGHAVTYRQITTADASKDGIRLEPGYDYHGFAKFYDRGHCYFIWSDAKEDTFFPDLLAHMLIGNESSER